MGTVHAHYALVTIGQSQYVDPNIFLITLLLKDFHLHYQVDTLSSYLVREPECNDALG